MQAAQHAREEVERQPKKKHRRGRHGEGEGPREVVVMEAA